MQRLKTAPWIVKIIVVLLVLGALLWIEGAFVRMFLERAN